MKRNLTTSGILVTCTVFPCFLNFVSYLHLFYLRQERWMLVIGNCIRLYLEMSPLTISTVQRIGIQQGIGTISYLKYKTNPDNPQSMDEKLCYILLVLPGLSLQPWEWAGPHGKGINVYWGRWPQPGTLPWHCVVGTVTTARTARNN